MSEPRNDAMSPRGIVAALESLDMLREWESLREEGRQEIIREIAAQCDRPVRSDYSCVFCGHVGLHGPHQPSCLWLSAQQVKD